MYKYKPTNTKEGINSFPIQLLSSEFDLTLYTIESQEKIWCAYQKIALCMRVGTSSIEDALPSTQAKGFNGSTIDFELNVLSTNPGPDHALNYMILDTGIVIVGLVSADSELYATFPGTVSQTKLFSLMHVIFF